MVWCNTMTEIKLESLSVSDLEEMLSGDMSLLNRLGIKEDEIREVLLEKKVFRLAGKIFDDPAFLISLGREVSVFEFDVLGNPTTQNAALSEKEEATVIAVKETLKRVIMAIENGVDLLGESR